MVKAKALSILFIFCLLVSLIFPMSISKVYAESQNEVTLNFKGGTIHDGYVEYSKIGKLQLFKGEELVTNISNNMVIDLNEAEYKFVIEEIPAEAVGVTKPAPVRLNINHWYYPIMTTIVGETRSTFELESSKFSRTLDVKLERIRAAVNTKVENVYENITSKGVIDLTDGKINYIKWDMNRPLTDVNSACLGVQQKEEISHRYVLGLYDILERITEKYLDVLIEGCSSGGARFDPGMLYYVPQNWTSDNTEVGKIASLLKTTSEKKTPLQVNLDQFGQKLSILILVFCAILFGISVFRGENIGNAFLFAVALAVAAIPEALSSIVTIVLSFGTQKMAKEHAIVRKLQAVEGLGSVSIICSDKTGTLTQNKMTVEHYYVDGQSISADKIDLRDPSQSRLLISSILCNDSTNIDGVEIGDPTETALINLGSSLGLDPEEVRVKYPRESENPFDSDRKMMATKHSLNGVPTMIVKGAVDVLLNRTDWVEMKGETHEITEETRRVIEEQNQKYSREGLRVLAFAYKEVSDETELTLEDEDHLIFLGLIAMMDPPREESKAAVEECKCAGIRPIMITGDHKVTAAAIAKRIGILENESEACEGAEIDKMSDEELKDFVEGISVYARVSPEHKIRIVRAWQEKGNIVSMTGDGVNDAPALKQADIGVAMGITGSEVSKDAAAMVLTDDNFATIIKAVENGRNIYRNIKASIQFLLSGNFGAILAVLYASLMALPVPFAPVHLLFINLLTDSLPAIALGLEPHSKNVMKEKPRPINESILTKDFLINIGLEGLSICTMVMIAFTIGYKDGNALLASTMAFATLCCSRLFHGFNCKSNRPVVFTKRVFNNIYLIGAFVIGMILITLVVTVPGLHNIFKVQTLTLSQLLTVYGLAALNLPIIQMIKAVRAKFRK